MNNNKSESHSLFLILWLSDLLYNMKVMLSYFFEKEKNMKLLIQRVKNAEVKVSGKIVRKDWKWIFSFNWNYTYRY